MWNWIKDKWNRVNDWCASWMPGLKTKIATGLGAVGSGAALLQEYVTGLPLDKFISGTKVLVITVVLFTFSFWFRSLSNRNV